MNAISGGWWTDLLYQYNDPDHLVMVGSGGWGSPKNCTLGENRARFTSGAVTGMMMVADNFALNDDSGNGDAALSRARAQEIMMNKDINEMADLGRSFMPVYGHKEHNGNADAAETCFMHIRRNTCMWPYLIIPTGSRPEVFLCPTSILLLATSIR